MRTSGNRRRICGGLALLFSLFATLLTAPAVTAQSGDSSITVHSRQCPTEYAGDNYFEDCHDTPTEAGITFTFSDGVTRKGATDANGNVGFANLPAGTYSVTGGVPGEFAQRVVYCAVGTEETSNQQQVATTNVTGGVQFDLPADTNVICDWYKIPYNLKGNPASTTAPTVAPTPQATETPQANGSSITVHDRVCPTEYSGSDYFADCHDNPVEAGLSFTFSNGVTRQGTTNENGNVGFANLPADTYSVTGGTSGEFAKHVVYCAVGTEEASNQEQIPVNDVTGGIQFDLPAHTNVICDWYEIPYNLKGNPTPTPTSTPLPPRRALEIAGGTCEPNGLTQTVAQLPDLRSPAGGKTVGQSDAIVAATSTKTIAVPLDDLLASDTVVVAYPAGAQPDAATPVACAPIGGTLNADGELVIGMREENDSGLTGIVYLAPSASDSSQTDVSVFVAQGLAQSNAEATPTP